MKVLLGFWELQANIVSVEITNFWLRGNLGFALRQGRTEPFLSCCVAPIECEGCSKSLDGLFALIRRQVLIGLGDLLLNLLLP